MKKGNDIALVQAPPWGLFSPPLGIAYLASYLEKKNISVKVFDVNVALFNAAQDKTLWNFERKDEWNKAETFDIIRDVFDREISSCVDRVIAAGPAIVGISTNQNSLLFSLEFARRLKQAGDVFVIAGGGGCLNAHERDILRRDGVIDALVVGEGEEVLYEFIEKFKNGVIASPMEGVLLKGQRDTELVLRSAPPNLDKLFFPTYKEFDLSQYGSPFLCLLSSRGCIGRCVFCNDRFYQGRIRLRSPEKIVEEIEYHLINNKISNFSFNDLLVNADLKHLDAWCGMIIKKKLKVKWNAQALARADMSAELLDRIKEAGCEVLQYGIESGSDSVLEGMGKLFKAADAEKVLRLTHDAGIQAWVNIIVGFPWEMERDFQETASFIERNRGNIDRVGSLNTCNVVFNSYMMNNKEEFGIVLSEKPELVEISWHKGDNCDTLRKERALRLKSVLARLNLPLGQDNLFVVPGRTQ
ncbi:MAG: B12-binding domain-containing radical SAM protein [Candidatus Omnitrophica bacterium]|jgi:radical SAM superfamily enzyme YgiQ (UPF0313 family)|nr:B12-binding domain-containing radical SAM protein [Candidatus Omnitrophota bacterium]